ncbi:COPI associated protein-domain-containing protein [Gongronella butleri]|nr:COPI associated protein-domain-containing protein [Gongronella butleri]
MVNTSLIFRIVNIIAAAFMIVGGVSLIISGGFPNFILAIFCILFGLIVILFEFKLPRPVTKLASFLFSFLGRGLLYIGVGCIMLNYLTLSIVCGVFDIVIGVGYVVCHFMPSIDAPSNMQFSTFENIIGVSSLGAASHYASSPSAPPATPSLSQQAYGMSPSANNSSYAVPSPTYTNTNTSGAYAMPPTVAAYPQKTYLPDESHIV